MTTTWLEGEGNTKIQPLVCHRSIGGLKKSPAEHILLRFLGPPKKKTAMAADLALVPGAPADVEMGVAHERGNGGLLASLEWKSVRILYELESSFFQI